MRCQKENHTSKDTFLKNLPKTADYTDKYVAVQKKSDAGQGCEGQRQDMNVDALTRSRWIRDQWTLRVHFFTFFKLSTFYSFFFFLHFLHFLHFSYIFFHFFHFFLFFFFIFSFFFIFFIFFLFFHFLCFFFFVLQFFFNFLRLTLGSEARNDACHRLPPTCLSIRSYLKIRTLTLTIVSRQPPDKTISDPGDGMNDTERFQVTLRVKAETQRVLVIGREGS